MAEITAALVKALRERTGAGMMECKSALVEDKGDLAVMVEINCESDFVARTADFQELVHDVAMHIAAADPRFIRKEDVTAEAIEIEKDIQRARALGEGKPEKLVDKIVEGRMAKFYEEICLLEQPFVKEAT